MIQTNIKSITHKSQVKQSKAGQTAVKQSRSNFQTKQVKLSNKAGRILESFYRIVLALETFNLPTLSPNQCRHREPVKFPEIKNLKILSASRSLVYTTHYAVVANANNKMKSCFM